MKQLVQATTFFSILWMIKGSNHFIYPTMNLYFTHCIIGVSLFLFTFFYTLHKRIKLSYGILEIAFLIWMVYIAVYALCFPVENYNVTYLSCSVLYYIGCVQCFRLKFFSLKGLGITLVIVGAIESIVCCLQFFGCIESHSVLFPVTGTLVDPNLTAMLIAWAVPFAFYSSIRNRSKRKTISLLLLFFLLTLILLKCRTAFFSVFFSLSFILAKEKKWFHLFSHQSLFKKTATITLAVATISMLSAGLYFYKQASAEGRIFIWKVSSEMISKQPLTGYGYGLFEKSYNAHQNKELKKEGTTEVEKKNARFTMLAFNDFIEQTVSGGLVGGFLFISIVLIAVWYSFRLKESWVTSCCVGILICMLVNFVVQSVVLWMVTLTLFAYVSTTQKKFFFRSITEKFFHITILSFLFFLSFLCSYRLIKTYIAQKKLKEAVVLYTNEPVSALATLKEYLPDADTSECYLRYYAMLLAIQGEYRLAKEMLEKAKSYTAHPAIEQELKRLRKKEITN